MGATVVAALVFMAVQAPVGDLWAARARQSAAAHGAVWSYWFSWFDGAGSPASYSVITPYLSTLVGVAVLGSLATVSTVALCTLAVRGTAHPVAAGWAAAVTCSFDLWSARIPFAVGTAFAAGVVLAVRSRRWWLAAPLALLGTLASPVVGALLLVALSGVVVCARGYRAAALAAAASAAVTLGVFAILFGSPGIEPLLPANTAVLCLGLVLMLLARPPRFVAVPVVLGLVVYAVLLAHPDALGSNFDRIVWIWLPIAVVATGRAPAWRTLAGVSLAVVLGVTATADDLAVATSPVASPAQYAPLVHELSSLPARQNFRVESVSDGTHDAAYELLGHALLAGGYETQLDNARNGVLANRRLTATRYRRWLDANAVGIVVFHRIALARSAEYLLVSQGLPYLRRTWSNRDWIVYRVEHARPIVTSPGRVLDADQASMHIGLERPASVGVRVAWSPALRVVGPRDARATVDETVGGFVRLTGNRAGRYVLRG